MVACGLLFNTMGVSAACGLAVYAVFFPFIVTSSDRIAFFHKKALVCVSIVYNKFSLYPNIGR